MYCNKVDKRRCSNWLLWCYFPKEITQGHHYNQSTSPSIDNETTLIIFLFLVGIHVKAGFGFFRENSWKWTPKNCSPQLHMKAGFWFWETSWKWTPQTCSQETLKHFHEKTSRNSPAFCFLPQNMFDLFPYSKWSQCLFTSQQIYSKCLLSSIIENV